MDSAIQEANLDEETASLMNECAALGASAPSGSADRTASAAIPQEAVTHQLAASKQQHVQSLQAVFASARKKSMASGSLAREIVSQAIKQIETDIDAFLKVALQTSESSEVHEHCLATAQLAISVGQSEGLNKQDIQDLGTGCVLSRIGQSEAAGRCAEQMRELNSVELIDLKRTPSRTFDLMQNMRDISRGARNIAYQIFERFDGSGYPRGRAGNQITPLARIAAVCDVYVALTSPRPHRAAYEPYAAVELLLQETRDGKFDPLAMRGLLRTIGLFPIGSFVRLTDGQIGQVVRNHHDHYDRPVVHLFLDDEGNCVQEQGVTIDLADRPELGVGSALSTEVVQELMIHALAGPGLDNFAQSPA